MQTLQKQPLHLLLAFQQPKHRNVNLIIDMIVQELHQTQTQYLTIYDQFGILNQEQKKIQQLLIKYENQQQFDDKLYEFYKSGKSLQEFYFSQYPVPYYTPQIIIFSMSKRLLGISFEYLKAAEIEFCDINNFDKQTLFSIYSQYSKTEQRIGK